MSDISLDLSGVIALMAFAALTIVLSLVAIGLLARACWKRRDFEPPIPLRASGPFQHAMGAGAGALSSLAAGVGLVVAIATDTLTHRGLARCDKFWWLWLFVVATVWLMTLRILRGGTSPPTQNEVAEMENS